MKITQVLTLALPEIKVIKFERFADHRGYFTETFNHSNFQNHPELDFLKNRQFLQCNESFSRKGTIRGLHFQWQPPMGKLVRCLQGEVIDLALDIRKNSKTLGKIIAYKLTSGPEKSAAQWIWLPPGFAHAVAFPSDSTIEYLCTDEYNPQGESSISPLSPDLDWNLCDPELKKLYDQIAHSRTLLMSEKDKNAPIFSEWLKKAA